MGLSSGGLPVAKLCERLLTQDGDSGYRRRLACDYIERLLASEHVDIRYDGDADVDVTAFANVMLAQERCAPEPDDLDVATSHWLLLQYAPMALTSGCLLQACTHAANSHEKSAALLHAVHRRLIGVDTATPQPWQPYRRVLESLGMELPALASPNFYGDPRILAASWRSLAWRASLSMRWDDCGPEILGAALFDVSATYPALVRAALELTHWRPRQARDVQALNHLLEAIRLFEAKATDVHAFRTRLARGFAISSQLAMRWHAEMISVWQGGWLSPWQAMIRLVEAKGRFAVDYHDRLKLDGRSFDEFVMSDPAGFVDALARSRWIVPGQPDESLLVTRLIAFGGPMFRIFQPNEIEVIRHWIISAGDDRKIAALPLAEDVPKAWTVDANQQAAPPVCRSIVLADDGRPPQPIGVRDLYYRLLNTDGDDDSESYALHYALEWLALTQRRLKDQDVARRGPNLPRYVRADLRAWFEQVATEQLRSYAKQSSVSATRSRQDVVNEAVQLCPIIFIDGAWLQCHADATMVESRIGRLLYQIFSDEIGNGSADLNHPNIYRALMEEMSVTLPAFPSRDFCHSPLFFDEAFLVPTCWLSLARFPRRFLPETLGLNLAMELSGVGGAYRMARDELRAHGFSTRFVDLHNTIDNVSSGHSAMALDAIDLYMDQQAMGCTENHLAQQWQRIRVGYHALSPPRRRFSDKLFPPRYTV